MIPTTCQMVGSKWKILQVGKFTSTMLNQATLVGSDQSWQTNPKNKLQIC